ncbi:hypothetical protein KBB96_09660 [Luteolibacter ambystomatis]|uniref:Uncharacterized protein n=1 Tax=Luteolibacter ambystomatis TaxID=2824561 RepID=A0A975J368_9BACT|nr:hypothetical protein [Luteolibacter ambystomatis]QUE53146.1 hypothetical protein KBB96_09660 [Luteolibacter ambystomatis]
MHLIHTLSERMKIHLGMPVSEFRSLLEQESFKDGVVENWNECSLAMEARTVHDLDCAVSVTFRDGILAKIEYGLMDYYGSKVVSPGPATEEN